jgi:hypothetical protein
MKKIFGWMILTVMLVSSACTGKVGPPGKDGEPTLWKIIDFTVKRNDWEHIVPVDNGDLNQIGSYFYYVFDVPEITEDIYEDGLIVCYYRYLDEFGDNVQSILTYTYYDIDVVEVEGEDDDGEYVYYEFPYCVQYSYDVMPGSIAFKIVFSDFFTDEKKPPLTCSFRLHLLY